MLTNLAKKVFGSRNDRLLKQYRKTVAKINAREAEIQALSDEALQAKTAEFKQRLANGATLTPRFDFSFQGGFNTNAQFNGSNRVAGRHLGNARFAECI